MDYIIFRNWQHQQAPYGTEKEHSMVKDILIWHRERPKTTLSDEVCKESCVKVNHHLWLLLWKTDCGKWSQGVGFENQINIIRQNLPKGAKIKNVLICWNGQWGFKGLFVLSLFKDGLVFISARITFYTPQAPNIVVIHTFGISILGIVSWKERTQTNITILFTALLCEIIFPLLTVCYFWLKHCILPSVSI